MISEFEEAYKKVKAGHSISKLTGNEISEFCRYNYFWSDFR